MEHLSQSKDSGQYPGSSNPAQTSQNPQVRVLSELEPQKSDLVQVSLRLLEPVLGVQVTSVSAEFLPTDYTVILQEALWDRSRGEAANNND